MKLKMLLFSFSILCCIPLVEVFSVAVAEQQPLQIPSVSLAAQTMVDSKSIAGAVVLVSHKGDILHLSSHGLRDVKEQLPMEQDTIFRIYSMTKPVTTVAAMILYEEGKLGLDDPIEQYVPEFKDIEVYRKRKTIPVNRKPTIRDLMRHTAGLTYGFFSNTPVDNMYKKNHPLFSESSAVMIDKLTQYPLLHQPGEKWHYSMATDVLGYVVEQVSGKSLGAFMQERIFDPLKMSDTAFHVQKSKIERFSSSYGPNLKLVEAYQGSPFLDPNRFQSGGGGLVSTAADYLKFSQMMLNKGELEGARILKSSSVEEMTKNQLADGDLAYGILGFGLGVSVQLYDWGDKGHIGEYGWSGAASTHFWVSPKDELVVIALSQHQPFNNKLKKAILPVVYEGLKQ